MTPKTKQEILTETRDFYAADPKRRAATPDNQSCFYETVDGRNCALGRCMIPSSIIKGYLGERTLLMCGYGAYDIKNLEEILKEEYRGHQNDFWCDVQSFHDHKKNWNENEISPEGQAEYSRLMEKYAE
jgi:hypothetical protein